MGVARHMVDRVDRGVGAGLERWVRGHHHRRLRRLGHTSVFESAAGSGQSPLRSSESVFIKCGPGVGGELLLWRMISPWRAKHRRSEPMLTISAGRPLPALDPSRKLPLASAKVFKKLSALEG